MGKTYKLTINNREAHPRSKRLRELGRGSASRSGSKVVNISGGGALPVEGHTHENKYYLDQISTDKDRYLNLTQLDEVVDPETGDITVGPITEKVKSGYADKAGIAHDLDEDSPVRQQFLSKLADDVAKGHITFEKGVTALLTSYFKGGAHFGNFVKGLAGAMIDEVGNAEFESITARGYLKVFELIYNRLNALEGTTSFADVGTIEEVVDGDNGAQVLTMRKRWDGDFTAFQPGDIVYGYVNNLNNGTAAEYYKAWAWIKAVDRTANTLTVVPYPDTEVPSGTNHALATSMIITRWGNNIEANAYTYANTAYSAVIAKRGDNEYVNVRQSTFYISCEDGNIVELMGVNKPILEADNYGTVLGKMPAGLLDPATQELVNKDQPYLFARGIIVQDLIRIDYEGKTTRTANYRGAWDATTAASATDYYRSTAGMYDTVTWNGALWQCAISGTTDEPTGASAAWVKMTASFDDGNMRLWTINPSVNIVSIRRNEVIPQRLSATVTRNSTENATQIFNNNYDLFNAGAKIYSSLDGINWTEFIIGTTEPLELEDGSGVIELEDTDGGYLTVGGDDISTDTIGDRIYFELRDVTNGTILASLQVPVVKDGEDGISIEVAPDIVVFKRDGNQQREKVYVKVYKGEDLISYKSASNEDGYTCSALGTGGQGNLTDNISWRFYIENGLFYYRLTYTGSDEADMEIPFTVTYKGKNYSRTIRVKTLADGVNGEAGRDGLMVYPAGMFDEATEYVATSETAPVVKYGDNFYVLRRGAAYKGTEQPDNRDTPAKEVANAPVVDGESTARWQIFDKFNAIFADIIMAEFAKLGSAVFYGDWMISQQGTRNGAHSEEYQYFKDGSFIPNYSVNFKTGEINAGNGTFSGYLRTKFTRLNESDALITVDTRDGKIAYLIQNDVNILSTGRESSTYTSYVLLPSDIKYAGTRVTICSYCGTSTSSRSAGRTFIRVQKGSSEDKIGGVYIKADNYSPDYDQAEELEICNGVIELLGVRSDFAGDYDPEATGLSAPCCKWFVLNNPAGMRPYLTINS